MARRRYALRRGRIHWPISVLVAATVGAAGFLMGGFEYRTTVDLMVTGDPAPAAVLDGLRRDLLDHAWRSLSAPTTRWQVEFDEAAQALRVTLLSPDLSTAPASLTPWAAAFVERRRAFLERARGEPGPEEVLLAELREKLAAERTALTDHLHRVTASLPRDDDEATDVELRAQVSARRAAYAQNRRRVQEAEAELAALGAAPLPERAAVEGEARERVIRADVETQQDLKALRVQLAEVRHQLLQAGQTAAPALAELSASAEQLEALCAGTRPPSAAGQFRGAVEQIGARAADYRALLAECSRTWTAELARLASLADDPRRAEVLDLQTTLGEALNGFSFQSAVPLTAMREHIRAVAEASAAPAEQHELISGLLRTFHTMQSAHQRFEFAAADVKPGNNFRLDAALKSARGLRHRSQQRLAQIEERLARQALETIRGERERRLAGLKNEINELRRTLDASMETLLDAEEQTDAHAPALQTYLQAKAAAAFYEARLGNISQELPQIETHLNDLTAKRLGLLNPDHLEVGPCHTDRWPVNLRTRLLQGALAGTLVLVLLVGLQTSLLPRRP